MCGLELRIAGSSQEAGQRSGGLALKESGLNLRKMRYDLFP
jgi:hypothetical protein